MFKEKEYELPAGYGDDRLILMVRDPYFLHAYWEIGEKKRLEIKEQQGNLIKAHRVLRVHHYSSSREEELSPAHFDIEVSGDIGSQYIQLERPDSICYVELGLVAEEGNFFTILKSNYVHTPPVPVGTSTGRK